MPSDIRLVLEPLPGAEIVHYASPEGMLTTHGRTVRYRCPAGQGCLNLPWANPRDLAIGLRLLRRLLRLDKCNVLPVIEAGEWKALIAIRAGQCCHVQLDPLRLTRVLALRQCRNVLHQSVCQSGSGHHYFGEYGSNPGRQSVPIYRSCTQGRSWECIFEFPAGKARHVHGCFWDPYQRRVWVCTGDFAGESHLVAADEDFKDLAWFGDGGQQWRTCHLMFTPTAIYWGTDSPLEQNHICRLDRRTGKLDFILDLPGPVWYAKRLEDGWLVAATVVERGKAVKDRFAHVFASRDGRTWQEAYRARKDVWKMPHFKNGVIAFADGPQTSDCFYLSAEALVGLDGRAFRARLEKASEGDPP